MWTGRKLIAFSGVTLVMGAAVPLAAQTDRAEEAAVLAVVQGFGDALAAGDSASAVSYLHPRLVVYEGGNAETLQEYRSHHLGADMAFLAAVEQNTTNEHLELRGETALYMSEYSMSGRYRDREIDVRGTETLVLARTPEGWKIRHIHWSSR